MSTELSDNGGVELVISPGAKDLGGFEVRRALPSTRRRLVGPFIFFDEMGPAVFAPGKGVDVRPHPHVCLATITYLFEGEIVHRDSLGFVQAIRPGAVNWMVAGRGIVHSERTGPEKRRSGGPLHGIQAWVAVPTAAEESEPGFTHHPAASLPRIDHDGASVTLIAGELAGQRSPAPVASPLCYADIRLAADGDWVVPPEYAERALYPVSEGCELNGTILAAHRMYVLHPGIAYKLTATMAARIMLIGGEPLDGKRHIWWNFVASSRERIEQAKSDWREGRMGQVPGETEKMPLPED